MNFDTALDRDIAQTVACPEPPHGCAAPIGQPCRNLRTGDELVHLPAHDARLKAAGVTPDPKATR